MTRVSPPTVRQPTRPERLDESRLPGQEAPTSLQRAGGSQTARAAPPPASRRVGGRSARPPCSVASARRTIRRLGCSDPGVVARPGRSTVSWANWRTGSSQSPARTAARASDPAQKPRSGWSGTARQTGWPRSNLSARSGAGSARDVRRNAPPAAGRTCAARSVPELYGWGWAREGYGREVAWEAMEYFELGSLTDLIQREPEFDRGCTRPARPRSSARL